MKIKNTKNNVPIVLCSTQEEIQDCISNADFIDSMTLYAIERMSKNGSNQESCLLIDCKPSEVTFEVNINKDEVSDAIDAILARLEEQERYEECAKILELKNHFTE
jgi:hypothetical protein